MCNMCCVHYTIGLFKCVYTHISSSNYVALPVVRTKWEHERGYVGTLWHMGHTKILHNNRVKQHLIVNTGQRVWR